MNYNLLDKEYCVGYFLSLATYFGMMLPNKAVLEGTMGPSEWSRNRYKKHDYYYAFYKDGKMYVKYSLICVDDSLYKIGDTVNILYLEALPFISSRIKKK